MGTPLATDNRLKSISSSLETLAEDLVLLLIENYNNKNLSLGSLNGTDVKSCFSITDSEFENIFLDLLYNGSSYSIEIRNDNADSPYHLNFSLDVILSNRFPKEMKEELQVKYDNSWEQNFNL